MKFNKLIKDPRLNSAQINKGEELAEDDPARKCRACGCTWFTPCLGGCYWVEPDLCSACAHLVKGE